MKNTFSLNILTSSGPFFRIGARLNLAKIYLKFFALIFVFLFPYSTYCQTNNNSQLSGIVVTQDTILKITPTLVIGRTYQNSVDITKPDSAIFQIIIDSNSLTNQTGFGQIRIPTFETKKLKPTLTVTNGYWSWEIDENEEITNQNIEQSLAKFKLEHPDIYAKITCDEAGLIEIGQSEFINLMPENKEFILAHPELYKVLPEK